MKIYAKIMLKTNLSYCNNQGLRLNKKLSYYNNQKSRDKIQRKKLEKILNTRLKILKKVLTNETRYDIMET